MNRIHFDSEWSVRLDNTQSRRLRGIDLASLSSYNTSGLLTFDHLVTCFFTVMSVTF